MVAISKIDLVNQIAKSRLVQEADLEPLELVPVAICTPMFDPNRDGFLTQYIYALRNLDYPKDLISLYFTVQGNDNTMDVMKQFKSIFKDEYHRIEVEKIPHEKGGELPHTRNIVRCRNILTDWSRPDPVLFIDHDNFPPPQTVKQLREAERHGGDIAAGVYTNHKRNEQKGQPGHIGFTAFFREGGGWIHFSFRRSGEDGFFSSYVLGKRLFADAVSMGTTLVQRRVLDAVGFYVPFGTTMTDDTAFCVKAGRQGFRFIADFGLLVPHWSFVVEQEERLGDETKFRVGLTKEFGQRREWMKNMRIYVNPDELS